MNSFDVVVYLGLILPCVTGYQYRAVAQRRHDSGLYARCRSRRADADWSSPQLDEPDIASCLRRIRAPVLRNSALQIGVDAASSPAWCSASWRAWRSTTCDRTEAGIGDRLGGATLGAVRVGLVAITLVLIFDQLVPANRAAGIPDRLATAAAAFGRRDRMGFRSLPPDRGGTIDRLKKERHI